MFCLFSGNEKGSKMDKELGKDLTVGSIPRHLLVFSIPMLIGNLARTGYHIINMIWVGHLVGKDATKCWRQFSYHLHTHRSVRWNVVGYDYTCCTALWGKGSTTLLRK